jgi:hypothetical protein
MAALVKYCSHIFQIIYQWKNTKPAPNYYKFP